MSTVSRPCLFLCVCLMGVTWALALPVQTSTPVPNIKVEPVTDGRSLATSEASQSERTSESSSTSLSHSETFTSERAPEIVTSEAAISTAFPLEASTTEKSIAKPPTNSQGEDLKLDSTTEVSKEPTDEVQCVTAWEKFLIDFGGHYHSEIEKEKRRTVFCDNWRAIKKHNKLFEQHMVPYEMDINQFSDLTFEEWKTKQMPRPGVMRAPEVVTSEDAVSTAFPLEASTIAEENLQSSTEKSIVKPPTNSQEEDSKVDSTTEVSEDANDQVLCRITWEKFLIDFGGHYHSEIEKEKRRNVFCDNWRSIKKHNKLFEQHMVPYEMDINQFSDLTFEEWKTKQMPRPGVMRAPEVVTSEDAVSTAFPLEASTIAEENLQSSTEKSIVKAPTNRQEEDSKDDSTTEVSEEANDQMLCRITWEKFLIDFGGHYHSEIEKEKRRNVFCDNWRSIKKHNKLFEQHMVPYEMDINQFSDLTFEEWKTKQMPRPVVMDRDF
ncbi:uncharacterized protein [Drosophila pseudoobscura]|uniref:Uncharacterized protein isoform X2 n=1 Tax=Drosophila pseudoobscura pseudoobscura TaxID=46245 RepID=A0A6I8VSN4_DROPS|nr:uncharacterized protein LOC6898805 isoform X2 [Drosophila pseudoobscura]